MCKNKGCIFIVEDDIYMRRMLSDFFKIKGYNILEAADGREALEIFYKQQQQIDIILLDIMMPYKDGFEVLIEIRRISQVPVIMLTAKREEHDQIKGFNSGADDYITKPFSSNLLLVRVQAVLKRVRKNKEETIKAGRIIIDSKKKVAIYNHKEIDLTPKEYDLLVYLIHNKDRVVSREDILQCVWDYQYIGDARTVDTHIKQIRAKLTDKCKYIKTVYGRGYRFEVPDKNNKLDKLS